MKETNTERVTDTIVFKHKRITNPQVSAADAITAAAHNLTDTIKTNMPKDLNKVNFEELERLAKIFQEAAEKVNENNARQTRVQSPRARTPRVDKTADEPLRVDIEVNEPPPLTSRYMTRQQKSIQGSITTDVMLTEMEIRGKTMSAQHLASQKFPMELLCEFAGAVMDDDTGDMLEYRQ